MLNSDDLAAMLATATQVRGDAEVQIVLVRGDDAEELPTQTVRLCYLYDRPIMRETPQGESATNPLLVKGDVDLDIQADDRFVYGDVAYVINMVRPDRRIETTAEARLLE